MAFVGVVVALSMRTLGKLNVPGAPDPMNWGLADFRDAIYYPVVAFFDGHNPYDPDAFIKTYPVGNRFPAYLPATLLVHAPFALLPFQLSELAYYLLTIALAPVIAAMALAATGIERTRARVIGIAAALLASRPGHWNLLLGQYTATMTIGTYLALVQARRRPWLAGLGLALATIKPTYGVPLALLMVLRGDWAAVIIATVVSSTVTLAATARLAVAAGGLMPLIASMQHNLATFNTGDAVESLFRVDAVSVVSRAVAHRLSPLADGLVTFTVLTLAAIAIRGAARRPEDPDAARLSAAAICVAMLLLVYHLAYGLVLLVWPITALVAGRWAPAAVAAPGLRWTLAALLLVPEFNYLATDTFLEMLQPSRPLSLFISSINGACLLAALGLYAVAGARTARARVA